MKQRTIRFFDAMARELEARGLKATHVEDSPHYYIISITKEHN